MHRHIAAKRQAFPRRADHFSDRRVDDARLRRQSAHLRRLGDRSVYEYIRWVANGALKMRSSGEGSSSLAGSIAAAPALNAAARIASASTSGNRFSSAAAASPAATSSLSSVFLTAAASSRPSNI